MPLLLMECVVFVDCREAVAAIVVEVPLRTDPEDRLQMTLGSGQIHTSVQAGGITSASQRSLSLPLRIRPLSPTYVNPRP